MRDDARLKNVVEVLAAEARGGIFEKFLANFFVEADGFKQMAIAIARDRGNSHAREHFAQAGFDRDAIFRRAARLQVLREFHREIREHGARAHGDQQRDVMRFDHLAGSRQ